MKGEVRTYQKKPVRIEAIQWTGTNLEAVLTFLGEKMSREITYSLTEKTIYIATLEGYMRASMGDFIIRGVRGEFYPCKPDIFEQTYDEVFSSKLDRIDQVLV